MSENLRTIDANLNRLREGIRVIEDILRYEFNNADLARNLKNLRHLCKTPLEEELINARDAVNDVLFKSTQSEMRRENLSDIITANFKRTQESARVLEEIFKLDKEPLSAHFKSIRYELYTLERQILEIIKE